MSVCQLLLHTRVLWQIGSVLVISLVTWRDFMWTTHESAHRKYLATTQSTIEHVDLKKLYSDNKDYPDGPISCILISMFSSSFECKHQWMDPSDEDTDSALDVQIV